MTPYQQELIRLANDEWLAYYQYWAGAAQVKNEKLKAELLEHADEERKHSDWLTDILAEYGLTPEKQFSNIIANTNCGYDMPVQISDGSILQSNLAAERCAIEAYIKVLLQTDNPEHHKVLHKILTEEIKHEQDLLELQKETQGMYLVKAIIRKSQMSFDFGKHEEERTVHATTRHMQSGAVAQVKEHQRRTMVADMHDMVHAARRWKGAAMNADEDHGTDNRARLKHSRMTTKADLDNYLMRKFGIDEVTARNVSNHLTEKDIPADRSAEPEEFAGEPWADAVLAKRRTMVVTPSQKREEAATAKNAEVFAVRQERAREDFAEALQNMAGITKEQADRVTQYYLDKRLATVDSVNGTIRAKHGAYLDKDVILNAVKLTTDNSSEGTTTNVRQSRSPGAVAKIQIDHNDPIKSIGNAIREAIKSDPKMAYHYKTSDTQMVISEDGDVYAFKNYPWGKPIFATVHSHDDADNRPRYFQPLNAIDIQHWAERSSKYGNPYNAIIMSDGRMEVMTAPDADTTRAIAKMPLARLKKMLHDPKEEVAWINANRRISGYEEYGFRRDNLRKFSDANGIMYQQGLNWKDQKPQYTPEASTQKPQVSWSKDRGTQTARIDFPESSKEKHHVKVQLIAERSTRGNYAYGATEYWKDKTSGKMKSIPLLAGGTAQTEEEAKAAIENDLRKWAEERNRPAQKTPSWHQNADLRRSVAHPVSLVKSRKLHGRMDYQGIPISIETGRSRIREWHNPHDNTSGMMLFKDHYGYITNGPDGTDGDKLDVFIGPNPEATNAYIIDQNKAPDYTEFDEQKVMLGYDSEEAAKAAYLKHYDNKRFFASIKTMPFEEFKDKIVSGKCHGKRVE